MDRSENEHWKALADGENFEEDGVPIGLRVVDCGELILPIGELMICEPYNSQIFLSEHVELEDRLLEDNLPPLITVSPGRYPVKATIADVSGKLDGSHRRNAYITLFLRDSVEYRREPIPDFSCRGRFGIGVDTGLICMVDKGVLTPHLLAEVEEREEPYWLDCLDDEDHIAYGVANLDLPGLVGRANMILLTSG